MGGVLQAVGILIGGASGLCSFIVVFSSIASAITRPENLRTVPMLFAMVAIVGGIPFGIGAALFLWGRSILRRANEDIENTYE